MKVFGLGTVAALADQGRYVRFTSSMLAVYGAMEDELDKTSAKVAPAAHLVWQRHGQVLRRKASLQADLADQVADCENGNAWLHALTVLSSMPGMQVALSPATERYVERIQ